LNNTSSTITAHHSSRAIRIEKITNNVSIPVIASGGFGKPIHLVELLKNTKVDAVAVADALHYSRYSIPELREMGNHAGREMREIG
jgi:cyclase